jgi:hypothetical protein
MRIGMHPSILGLGVDLAEPGSRERGIFDRLMFKTHYTKLLVKIRPKCPYEVDANRGLMEWQVVCTVPLISGFISPDLPTTLRILFFVQHRITSTGSVTNPVLFNQAFF